ncbi:MAG: acyl-CoA dehydrogenase family protein [Actinomycetota bacterium]
MHIDLTTEQRWLRDELRAYFESIPRTHGRTAWNEPRAPDYRDVCLRLGRDGWLGIGWPVEYGGQGRGPVEQLIFFEEAERARVPMPVIALNTVGPTLMRFGTEEQKAFFLPKVLAGKIDFAIGYTEPEAGTDLASLRTRAVRDGDDWVVNGNKIFTSGAEDCEYVWLAARTNTEVPKHRGISILIVDTNDPGFKATPITTLAGLQTTATYYEDVRVPPNMLVGEENQGWTLITNQLNHERVALATTGWVRKIWEDVVDWARAEEVIDVPWVQLNLARVDAMIEALKLFNWRVAAGLESGALSPADASAQKVFGTESYIECYRLLLEVLGRPGYIKRGSPGAVLNGVLEQAYRSAVILTFGGGVNEVQRMIIATAGLGMPRG